MLFIVIRFTYFQLRIIRFNVRYNYISVILVKENRVQDTVKIQTQDLRLEKGLSIDLCGLKVFEWKLTSIKMTFKQRVLHKIC